jgi:uncharacterized protein YneF (UPF0154 family)
MWWWIAIYIVAALVAMWFLGGFIAAGRGKDED